MGFQVSTPWLFVSTIQSSSGRVVSGKPTFLNWMVWTVVEVGIILAMRGMYAGDEGSSLLKNGSAIGVEIRDEALAWVFERTGVDAMASAKLSLWTRKGRDRTRYMMLRGESHNAHVVRKSSKWIEVSMGSVFGALFVGNCIGKWCVVFSACQQGQSIIMTWKRKDVQRV